MGRQAAFESGAGALAEHGPHRREILRSQSEAFDEVMVVDGAFPLSGKVEVPLQMSPTAVTPSRNIRQSQ